MEWSRLYALLLGASLLSQREAAAQALTTGVARQDFSHIGLSIEALFNRPQRELANYWESGRGLAASVYAPYGLGFLSASVQLERFHQRNAAQPRFDLILPHAGIGASHQFPAKLTAQASAHVGAAIMRWANDDSLGMLSLETEVLLGGTLRLRRPFLPHWALTAAVHYNHIFTAVPIRRRSLTFGAEFNTAVSPPVRRALGASEAVEMPPANARNPLPGATRITGVELRRAGVVRLGDIVRHRVDWSGYTVDHLTMRTSVRGAALGDEAALHILLDGQPIPLSFFGSVLIERIPVALADIDVVELRSMPALSAGEIRAGGIVDLQTRKSATTRAHGALAWGNEIDDPGPFRFIDGSLRNIDHPMSDYSAGAAAAFGPLLLAANYVNIDHIATGRGIERRTVPSTVGYPVINVTGGLLQASLGTGALRASATAGVSDAEDIVFLPFLGGEVPNRNTLAFAHAAVSRPITASGAIEVRAAVTRNEGQPRANTVGLTLDLAQRTVDAAVEVKQNLGSARLTAGVHAWQRRATAPVFPRAYTDTRIGPYASLDIPAGSQTRIGVQGNLGWITDHTDGGALVSLAHTTASRNELQIQAAIVRQSPARAESHWLWQQRGFDVFQRAGYSTPLLAGSMQTRRLVTLDASWGRPLTTRHSMRIEGFAREHHGVWALQQRFDVVDGAWLRADSGVVNTDLHGRTMGAIISFESIVANTVTLMGSYALQTAAGSNDFEDEWDVVPMHQALLRAQWLPRGDLSLSTAVRGRSSMRFADYEVAESLGVGVAGALKSQWTAEAGVEKAFLGNRVLGSFLLRNAFGSVRTHPVGAALDLTAVFKAQLVTGK